MIGIPPTKRRRAGSSTGGGGGGGTLRRSPATVAGIVLLLLLCVHRSSRSALRFYATVANKAAPINAASRVGGGAYPFLPGTNRILSATARSSIGEIGTGSISIGSLGSDGSGTEVTAAADGRADGDGASSEADGSLSSSTQAAPLRPDWRAVADCPAHHTTCALSRSYAPYPFHDGGDGGDNDDGDDHAASRSARRWQVQNLSVLPPSWRSSFEEHRPSLVFGSDVVNINANAGAAAYTYPPPAPHDQYDACRRFALTEPFDKQMDAVLSKLRLKTFANGLGDGTTVGSAGTVAYTISDEAYSRDMLHDVFDMADRVVGFGGSFFLVALDEYTVDEACRFGYDVVACPALAGHRLKGGGATTNWTTLTTAEKNEVSATVTPGSSPPSSDLDPARTGRVYFTKFDVALALLERQISFLFFEMDVWFLRSPASLLRNQRTDLILSSHQHEQRLANIGVYAVRSTDASREYFAACRNVTATHRDPPMHDQLAMNLVDADREKYWPASHRKSSSSSGRNVTLTRLDPHLVVSAILPVLTETTIAVHVLGDRPLQAAHGKKIMAKELGVWHGLAGGKEGGGEDLGGYYARTGSRRRYLFLDGPGVLGGLSLNRIGYSSKEGRFHVLCGVMATLAALSRRTGRILVLPKIFTGHRFHFVWPYLDLASLEEIVPGWRETNFPTNPKAWYDVERDVPFQSVARLALYQGGELFAETADGKIHAWHVEDGGKGGVLAMDALFALSMAMPQIRDVEALFVNPQLINQDWVSRLLSRHELQESVVDESHRNAEAEVLWSMEHLAWCHTKLGGDEMSVAQVTSSDDCYGRGKNLHGQGRARTANNQGLVTG